MIKTLTPIPLLALLQTLPSSATVQPLAANGICEEIYLELLYYQQIDDNEAHEIYENCLDFVGNNT